MKLRGILFLMILIYPFASFAENPFTFKYFNFCNSYSFLDSNILDNNVLVPLDSITNNNTNPISAPADVISINPVSLPKDSISIIPVTIPIDTINLLNSEPVNITADSINALQNVPSVSPTDSAGLIKVEKIPTDSVIILNTKKDSVARIEFRSVYADSVEQGNPNFLPRNVLIMKWITDDKRDTVIRYKNLIGFHTFYGTYSYGIGGGMFLRLSNDADFIANINFAYLLDKRTESDLDSNGTMQDLERQSRLFSIIFNAGLEKYFMQNRTSWKIKPVILFGFAPAIVFAAPYSESFFKSIFKSQLSFGVGVFAALGFDWQAFNKVGINLTVRYSIIPIIGRDIYYYKGFLIKNIGGINVNLGITLLKEYFSKD